MKNTIRVLALGVVSLGISSCADSFLDTTSKSSLNDENFYRTVSDAQRALTGCYDGYQAAYSYDGATFHLASELMSDDCFAGGGTGDDTNMRGIDRFSNSFVGTGNIYEPQWKKYYTAINRCNTLLSKDGQINWTDEATRLDIMGQCRALRALCYFDLTRLFGSVPLLEEPTVAKVPEAAPADIYALIAEDLMFAAENIHFGAYNESAWTSTNNGLISEWAAKALLARVYLFYTGYYGATDLAGVVTKTDVQGYLVDIIDNGGFGLLDDFSTLWPCASRQASPDAYAWAIDNYAGESNKEILFGLKFDSASDEGTNHNGSITMVSMRNSWLPPYGTGWGVCTVNPALYEAYETGDKRRDASIIDIVGEGVTTGGNFNSAGDWREYTGYSIKKYSAQCYYDGKDLSQVENPAAANIMYFQGQDFYVVRYADVLLMAAELDCPNAQTYFDMVRTRAGLSSKALTKDNILEERHLEFAFEGLRYWDLLRQGTSVAARILVENQNNVTVSTGGIEEKITISESDITNKKGLSQKPTNQIILMGTENLTQNTGW